MAPTILAFFTTFLPILYCVWLSVFFSRKTLFVLVVFALFWMVNAILLEEAPGGLLPDYKNNANFMKTTQQKTACYFDVQYLLVPVATKCL